MLRLSLLVCLVVLVLHLHQVTFQLWERLLSSTTIEFLFKISSQVAAEPRGGRGGGGRSSGGGQSSWGGGSKYKIYKYAKKAKKKCKVCKIY